MGNPLLLPEYTNSYELNFQKKFNSNFVSFEAYARQTNNKIEEITMIDPLHPDVFISTYDNIGKDLSIGGELMANLNLTKWWNFNLSGDGFYYEIITADANNNPSNFSWSARLNNTFRLRKTGTSFQLGGFYEGPEISSQGTSTSAYLVNAGLRQDFLDRKLSISINVRDVFGTMNHTEISQTDQFYSYSHRIRKSPTFNLSITYKINDFSSRKEKGAEGENEGGDEGM
jgi:outer membrane receptor protein involved in Fe transport